MKKNPDSDLVIKSNKLISARYRLTPAEQKVILILASKINKDDEDFKPYIFKTKDLLKLLGVEGENHFWLMQLTYSLVGKKLQVVEDDGKHFIQMAWLSGVKYSTGEGIVEFQFSPYLKPYLLQLKESFTKYQLQNVIAIKSGNAIRLYEILKQYEKIGWRRVSIIELKKMLGMKGTEYKRYNDFKRKVIIASQKEIAEKTDIRFTFEEIKTGRKITSLKFIIQSQTRRANSKQSEIEEFLEEPTKPDEIDAVLRKYNIIIGQNAWAQTVKALQLNFTQDEIAKIAVTLNQKTREGLIKNAAGILVKDPVGIGKSILDGTFYADKRSSKTIYQDNYEIYVPPKRVI
jgi:plasmid replication initiation protein